LVPPPLSKVVLMFLMPIRFFNNNAIVVWFASNATRS
jgi:hypothetical protein